VPHPAAGPRYRHTRLTFLLFFPFSCSRTAQAERQRVQAAACTGGASFARGEVRCAKPIGATPASRETKGASTERLTLPCGRRVAPWPRPS
jgi:hypothetical protein